MGKKRERKMGKKREEKKDKTRIGVTAVLAVINLLQAREEKDCSQVDVKYELRRQFNADDNEIEEAIAWAVSCGAVKKDAGLLILCNRRFSR